MAEEKNVMNEEVETEEVVEEMVETTEETTEDEETTTEAEETTTESSKATTQEAVTSGISSKNLSISVYNGAYMLPELIFTLVGAIALLKIPQTKRIITQE